jgi:hypothetical protein
MSFGWKKMFHYEVNKKVRHMHQSNPKMTRRAVPPHYVNGFIQDKVARDKINQRMFGGKEVV